MPLSVNTFISYATEDRAFAQDLYLRLRARGLEPWMDKPPPPHDLQGLRPGEDWRRRLDREIRSADRLIMILSPASVAKVGYVQREFRLALDVMNDMPVGARFAVPILIERCEIPELVVDRIALRDLQWTAIYETGIERFLDALEADARGAA